MRKYYFEEPGDSDGDSSSDSSGPDRETSGDDNDQSSGTGAE